MEVRRLDARAFLAIAGPTLRAAPVVNQLPLAIANTCVIDPRRYTSDLRFYVTADGGAALQTPPWPVQLAACSPDAAAALARTFAQAHEPIAGVAGPDDMALPFADAYAREANARATLAASLGVFELTAVADVPTPAGTHAIATAEHEDLLGAWLAAFHDEATPHDPAPVAGAAARVIATGRVYLWLDGTGTPVSYAFNNRNVEGWASLGPVFTPVAERGRGYATALVAATSRRLLAEGRRGCTLFTDLANPTSNAIYERIGYRRVGIAKRFAFAFD